MLDNRNKLNKGRLITVAALVGVVGDFSLQILTKLIGGKTGWGLNSYFKQHGQAEAIFIAGGMMAMFYMVYIYVLRLPITVLNLAIYGVVWDLVFRMFKTFGSLEGYYKHLNYFFSGLWGAIPMVAPYLLYCLCYNKEIHWVKAPKEPDMMQTAGVCF